LSSPSSYSNSGLNLDFRGHQLIGRTQSIGAKKRSSQLVAKMSYLPRNFLSKKRIGGCFGVTLVVLTLIIVLSIEVPKSEKTGKHHQKLQGFAKDFNITWAPDHTELLDNDQILELKLDNTSGTTSSCFCSMLESIGTQSI